MWSLHVLLATFALFVSVHSVAIEQRSAACSSANIALVKQQIADTLYFCTFYLDAPRTRSPIPGLDANTLFSTCKCISSSATLKDRTAAAAAIKKASANTSLVSLTCPSASANFITKEYENPSKFCAFFNAYPRTLSPVPNESVKAVYHACNCILKKTSSTSLKHSTSTAKTSTKQTSTSKTSSIKKISVTTQKSSTTGSSKSSSTLKPTTKTSVSPSIVATTSSHASSISTSSSKVSKSTSFSSSSESSSTSFLSISSSTTASTPSSAISSSITRSTPSSASSSSEISTTSYFSSSSSTTASTPFSASPSLETSTISSFLSSSLQTPTTSSLASTSTEDAYNVITSQNLQPFCSSYLSYTIPYTTLISTQTITEVTTQTDSAVYTEFSTYVSVETDIDVSTFFSTSTITTVAPTSTADPIQIDKRIVFTIGPANPTPSQLQDYSNVEISSGCSRAITHASTSTILGQSMETTIETALVTTTTTATAITTLVSSTIQDVSTTIVSITTVYTTPIPVATQFVVNPSFEDEDSDGSYLTPWTVSDSSISVDDVGGYAYDGENVLRIIGSGGQTKTFQQTLSGLTPGVEYTLVYHRQISGYSIYNDEYRYYTQQHPFDLDVYMDNQDAGTSTRVIEDSIDGSDTSWVMRSGTWTATDTSAVIFFQTTIDSEYGYFDLYIDDVTLTVNA